MAMHVVVGAGTIGSTVARQLADDGEQVRVLTRSGGGPQHAQVERVRLDATNAEGLARASEGAAAIYNCANPPYHRWSQEWPPIAAALLHAAESSGAVLATCANLYAYGEVDGPMTEDLPLAAAGSKGRVRARMWQDALAAHQAGRLRATEVRASDYLGPRGTQSHLGEAVMSRLLCGKGVWIVGDPDTPHSWSYTADVARMVTIAARDPRAWGRPWHAPTNPARTARELVAEMCRTAGVAPVAVRRVPGWVLAAGRPLSATMRELPEVMHQHTGPWLLDSSAAERELGARPTAWDDVLSAIVADHRRPAASEASGLSA